MLKFKFKACKNGSRLSTYDHIVPFRSFRWSLEVKKSVLNIFLKHFLLLKMTHLSLYCLEINLKNLELNQAFYFEMGQTVRVSCSSRRLWRLWGVTWPEVHRTELSFTACAPKEGQDTKSKPIHWGPCDAESQRHRGVPTPARVSRGVAGSGQSEGNVIRSISVYLFNFPCLPLIKMTMDYYARRRARESGTAGKLEGREPTASN